MKEKIILITLLFLAVMGFAGILPVGFAGYDKTKPPALSLPDAYNRASTALGIETNQFHCISAEIKTEFSPDGEWYFVFFPRNTNTAPRCIAVQFSGKVIFDHGVR